MLFLHLTLWMFSSIVEQSLTLRIIDLIIFAYFVVIYFYCLSHFFQNENFNYINRWKWAIAFFFLHFGASLYYYFEILEEKEAVES